MAMTTGKTEKTLRKWVGIGVDYIASIDNWVCAFAVQYNSSFVFIGLSQICSNLVD